MIIQFSGAKTHLVMRYNADLSPSERFSISYTIFVSIFDFAFIFQSISKLNSLSKNTLFHTSNTLSALVKGRGKEFLLAFA